MTEMLVGSEPWRSFSLISHSKLGQVSRGFVQPSLKNLQGWRYCNNLGIFSYAILPSQ